MDQMEDVQFLFVTAYEPESTKAFLEDHHIGNFPNIRFGYDINLTLQQHYQLYAVPSSTCTIPMDNLAMNGRAIHLWKCSKTRWMGK